MLAAHIYDSGTDQYLTVDDLSIIEPHHSLVGTNKFYPGNNGDKFMVDGFTFHIPTDVQFQVPDFQERVVFMKRNGNVTELVAVGIVNRMESALSFSQ